MIYQPTLQPLLERSDQIYINIRYDKRFTRVYDVTHDEDHIHDFFEIYVNLRGDVSFLVDDHVYPIGRGDIIVTAPNEIHRCLYHSDCLHEHFCIWIRALQFKSDPLKAHFVKNKLLVLPDDKKEKMIEACFALYNSRNEESPRPFVAAKSFFEILDILSTDRCDTIEAQSLPSGFSEIIEYISEHYTEPTCTVAHICETFYISQSTICRRFRRYFQTTPSDYIEAKRFSEAKKLLSAGHSVQSACLNSGFSDCSYFIMRFRKKFGITPYQYQKGSLSTSFGRSVKD